MEMWDFILTSTSERKNALLSSSNLKLVAYQAIKDQPKNIAPVALIINDSIWSSF